MEELLEEAEGAVVVAADFHPFPDLPVETRLRFLAAAAIIGADIPALEMAAIPAAVSSAAVVDPEAAAPVPSPHHHRQRALTTITCHPLPRHTIITTIIFIIPMLAEEEEEEEGEIPGWTWSLMLQLPSLAFTENQRL